jgi:hypothetical protein
MKKEDFEISSKENFVLFKDVEDNEYIAPIKDIKLIKSLRDKKHDCPIFNYWIKYDNTSDGVVEVSGCMWEELGEYLMENF